MRKSKIRGHKRRHKQIQSWVAHDSKLDLALLEKYSYWNSDIYVHPWCDISIINSTFPEPKGQTRDLMIAGLETIYDKWKIALEKLGRPYYLKSGSMNHEFPNLKSYVP
jgi:hypothetical protein